MLSIMNEQAPTRKTFISNYGGAKWAVTQRVLIAAKGFDGTGNPPRLRQKAGGLRCWAWSLDSLLRARNLGLIGCRA